MNNPRKDQQVRRALRHVSDDALIDAMREGTSEAWQEFMMRFRPLLMEYGHRTRRNEADWISCVETVLEEAAMRWAIDGAPRPRNVASYLLRAAAFHSRTVERDAKRRAARCDAAAEQAEGQGVVLSLCSEASVRYSHGPADSEPQSARGALGRFCKVLRHSLTEEEWKILGELGDGLPYRDIATELGLNYEAARKRIQRLCARVRGLVPAALEQLSTTDRAQVERLLRRARPTPSTGVDDAV